MFSKFSRVINPQKSLFRRNRRGGRGVQRVKSFDPTGLIQNQEVSDVPFQEYSILNSFNDFKISDLIKQNIRDKGYKVPTAVQDRVIPQILEGHDLIGIANTGTGKTAAFLIPLIEKVLRDKSNKVLIVAPTRELAMQIKDEFLGFSKGLGIYSCLCIGGANIGRQVGELMRNPNFVIGTPGRILDLIRNNNLNLSSYSSVVLDEADRMVDIGFVKDIKYIISLLPRIRQSLFFSATISGEVSRILERFVVNPVTVSVKTRETSQNVDQKVIRISDPGRKVDTLHELLIQKEFEKVLVFGRTKHGVQRLSDELVKRGFRADAIHGNKKQSQRVKILQRFKSSEIKILIATDVASRGLDIPNVSHIVNFDLPETKDAYIHRIGRTGRADKKGTAVTFI